MKIKVLIVGVLVLISGGLLINGLVNEEKTHQETNTTTNETSLTTTSTNTTTTKKTTKKVVKTTKKTTTKKVQKFNIKYNKQEIIDYVHKEVVRRWGEDNWNATYQIIMHESGFNPNSVNKSSGACGLFQALPCNKTIKNGYKDYYTNWKTQVNWGLDYIKYRYKTPLKVWNFWQKHHWY